jgi:hypothetical protein
MAKNFRLIPDERNNWEVAMFLLIDNLYRPNEPKITFSRTDMHSSIRALNFIEKLLGPIGYEVNKTLGNSISSAITSLVKKGYLKCADGQCELTNEGFNRLQVLKDKFDKNDNVAIGKNKKVFDLISTLSMDELKKALEIARKKT